MRDQISPVKMALQQEIDNQITAFLKAGGEIQVIPAGLYKQQYIYLNESPDGASLHWKLRRMVPEKPKQANRGRLEAYKIVDGSTKSLAAAAGREAYKQVIQSGGDLMAAKAARKKTERAELKRLLNEAAGQAEKVLKG